MNFFVRNRPQRHTAFAVLLAWLFALASGVANACMLQADQADQVDHSQRPHESLAVHAHGPAQQADHEGGSAGHHKDADANKAPCLKVCDDSTHALVKATSVVDRGEPFPAIWVTVLWTVATPPSSAVHGLDDLARPIPGPPLRLCYSRLAL